MVLLVVSNLFLLFEVFKMSGDLSDAKAAITKLQKQTTENQKGLNALQTSALYNYIGGGGQ